MIKVCKGCNEEKEHHAKGLCYNCYRKFSWKPRLGVCKRCKREMPIHARGLCPGCYNFVFHLDKNKSYNYRKKHGIDPETYKKITKNCIICGFNKIVDLHHLDKNKKNIFESNFIGLCPNHHKMLHDFRYRKEIFGLLKEKGINIPEDPKLNFKI